LNQLFYELPLEELQTFPERVRSVSPDDVQRVARNYFRPDRLAVVLVGNADAFVKDLKGVGFGEFERIPIDQVDLLAADLRKGGARIGGPGAARQPSVRPTAVGRIDSFSQKVAYQEKPTQTPAPDAAEQEKIDVILKKAVHAHGGLEALMAVKRLTADSKTTLTTPDGKIAATTKTTIEYPDRVRVDAQLPDAQIVQVYADGKGWLKDPGGVHDAPPEMLKDFHAGVLRDPLALVRAIATKTFNIALRPEEGDQGRVLKVLAISGQGLAPVRLFFDPQQGSLVKIGYDARGQGPLYTEELFDDYRTVDGVRVPFKASIIRNGVVVLERILTDVKINPPLAPDTFTKPIS
jgi:hypothetical protein